MPEAAPVIIATGCVGDGVAMVGDVVCGWRKLEVGKDSHGGRNWRCAIADRSEEQMKGYSIAAGDRIRGSIMVFRCLGRE